MSAPSQWLVWQLADSAFPTGGFAHSAGLEAACQHSEVRNRGELRAWIEASLEQTAAGALPFVNVTHPDPTQFEKADRFSEAFLGNHVARRASQAQGRAFLAAAERIFRIRFDPDEVPHGHYAPVFGGVTGRLGLERLEALRLFLFSHLRGVVAAAVRLNVAGPMEGQALQRSLAPLADALAVGAADLGLDDIAQPAPLLDIWQGAQDRLYSRLFQS
jgi:urease accessory protein